MGPFSNEDDKTSKVVGSGPNEDENYNAIRNDASEERYGWSRFGLVPKRLSFACDT